MDYAYGPGQDPTLQIFADFYQSRANTTLLTVLSGVGLPSLEGLVSHLDDLPAGEKPIGDAFICSHGNESGWLSIRLTSILPVRDVDFDTLLQHRVRLGLEAATITPPGGGQPGTTIRFLACRIGHAEPFMLLLKNAFGGQARISASEHFFSYGTGNVNGQDVVFEYLNYSFLLTRRNTRTQLLANRAQAIAAFRGAGFQYYTGAAIPNAQWERWMPGQAPRHKTTAELRFRLAAGEPLFNFDTEFRAERINAPDAIPFAGNQQPAQDAARTQARNHLQTLEHYQNDWPPGRPAGVPAYPVHARNGFNTLDAFVNAHQWTLGQVGGQSALIGSRMEYTLLVPLFDPASNLLLHNLVPTNGAGPPAPRTGLDENNAALFWNQ